MMNRNIPYGLSGVREDERQKRLFFFMFVPLTILVMVGAAYSFTKPRPLDKTLARHEKAK